MAKEYKKRKYRVRYDRVVIVVLILVALAVIISSCTKFFLGSEEPETSRPGFYSAENSSTSEPENPTEPPSETDSGTETEPGTSDSATDIPQETTSADKIPDGYKTEIHSYEDIYKGNLVLVNADYEYKFLTDDIDPVTLFDNRNDFYESGDYVTKLDTETLSQLNAMIKAYADANYIDSKTGIFVLDGYRTYEEQVERHNTGKSRTFEAGHTDYHTGRTFDMFYNDSESGTGFAYFSAEGDYEWFAENAGNYGFIVRFPEDKQDITGEKPRSYTYRYVGTPHAVYINENNLCMEEYIEELKTHTIDNPLQITANGQNYSVYYTEAEKSDVSEITVPANKLYEVSGNNDDGFIVTVKE
ncbi:MAG: M15 family metallopeptidase [Ruminococcus flavefaciens]|nr:M15 family metallopeptidase [Ruminococcus flavefaciens]MCM1229494.1 M15 family metallopeptidase [Ruminococcus flavefaciens]